MVACEVGVQPQRREALEGHPARLHKAHAPKRQADGVDDESVITDVQTQNKVQVETCQHADKKRTRDGEQGARGHLANDFGLVLGDILVNCYREHIGIAPYPSPRGNPS